MKKLLCLLLSLSLVSSYALRGSLLDGVTANTTGTAHVSEKGHWKFIVTCTGGSVGGIVNLQEKDPNGNWITFYSLTNSVAGTTIIIYDAPMHTVRANLASYSAGTFSVYWDAL